MSAPSYVTNIPLGDTNKNNFLFKLFSYFSFPPPLNYPSEAKVAQVERILHVKYPKIFILARLRGLSPRANYTDRATAACRRSDCQLLLIEGATWSA
jgi:hypothetical protein